MAAALGASIACPVGARLRAGTLTMGTTRQRRLGLIRRVQARNVLGAVLAFLYFRVLDPLVPDRAVTWGDVAFFVVALALLALTGIAIGIRVNAPLVRPERHDPHAVRRAAIMFPYTMTAVAMTGWALAGIIFGVLWPWVTGVLSPYGVARSLFGITVIGGGVTAAFIFLSAERVWRDELRTFFPDGDLSAVTGVPQLGVRMRLLAVFTLTSVVPLVLLAIVAYRRTALVAADPSRAGALLTEMLVIMVFLVAVGLWAAIGLSLFVAGSVAAPLRELEASTAKVERGDLEARAPVVSNDEIGRLAEGFNRMLAGLKERDFLKDTFGKYVTREIRDEILAGRVGLEGEQREVTILFADLRDFTSWVEATEPREVVRDLNRYFGEMETAVRRHGGLVLQFYALVGDAVNLASRIQDLTKTAGADILISATTRAALDGAVAVTPLAATRVKGRSAEVEVFAVVR